jgi:dTDP-4-amino-4,6-dideoxygalactose transaminase
MAPVREQAVEAFAALVDSAAFTLGDALSSFEREFADYCGVDHCVGVSDGTAALRMALLALGVTEHAEVITVPNTFVATVEAIESAGARPTLVDVSAADRCMDPQQLRGLVGDDTGAVIPVHLYGRPAPMDEITMLCRAHSTPVLEDAAQAHGALLGGSRIGSLGDAAAFSFYPTKNLGAMGDAGAVVCRDPAVDEVVRSLRHHGAAPGDSNRHVRPGSTARLDNIQAAFLSLRLARLDAENEQRRQAADTYRALLADLPLTLPPPDGAGMTQVHHLFVVEVAERDQVAAVLREHGIGFAVHYPTPIHLQPGWSHLGYARGDFPVAERLAQQCLSLPCFPGIREDELERVTSAMRLALG